MATALGRTPATPAPNQSSFTELYAFERPTLALSPEAFVEEMKELVRAHPVDATLANALKYGTASREHLVRWIKDYYHFIKRDAQGTAAMVARSRRRGLFIALSQLVNRKTGFYQVTRPPRELYLRFAAAFGVSETELEAHYPCPETMQATFSRLHLQFSGFEEGFAVTALGAEGPLLDVVRDERPWLCGRGLAEYMKRAYQLDDDAVSYWRAYEDFRSFVTEPVWDVLKDVAVDASSQAIVRTAFHHWLLIYQNARRAWGEIVGGTYGTPDFVWPPAGSTYRSDAEQTYEEMGAELADFCLALERPAETAFGLVISGKASMDALRELVRDFIHLDATRNIAGQLTRLDDGSRAFRAVAQAFATESGGYLTRNHMEIWADFCERALGITREDLFTWTPPTETIASRYVTSWFLVHGAPEEAIAAFHLGPPTKAKEAMGKRALGLGQGGVAGEGLINAAMSPRRPPISLAFERMGVEPDLADYFFKLHAEIEPFEQDEGWEYVPTVVRNADQRRRFKRAYVEKILSERGKDAGLLRRMKKLSGLA
jgi:pyrroloquinoline quinone (PQQ) biosynthesis protein C